MVVIVEDTSTVVGAVARNVAVVGIFKVRWTASMLHLQTISSIILEQKFKISKAKRFEFSNFEKGKRALHAAPYNVLKVMNTPV